MSAKILVLENDKDILEIITLILSGNGIDVLPTSHDNLFKDLFGYQPQLLIVDHMQTAEKRDLAIFQEIHSHSNFKSLPIILISASFRIDEFAKSCKATAYISKPFDIDYFTNTVTKVLVAVA